MKRAKKRYFKKEPEFWKILKRTNDPNLVGYKGQTLYDYSVFYAPYIPLAFKIDALRIDLNEAMLAIGQDE